MAAPQLFEPIDRVDSLDADQAQREAVRLLQAAQIEAEEIRAEAQAQGFAAGMTAARVEAAPLLETAGQIAAAAAAWRETHEDRLAVAAAEIAITAAARIVEEARALNPELVAQTLKRALARVNDQAELRVAVHPDDLQFVRESWPELAVESGAADALIVADQTIGRGGAILTTPAGELDATVEGQLAELTAAVRETLGA